MKTTWAWLVSEEAATIVANLKTSRQIFIQEIETCIKLSCKLNKSLERLSVKAEAVEQLTKALSKEVDKHAR